MKLVHGLGLAALLLSAACSFSTRSGAFECSDTNPCADSNRDCVGGWCVVAGSGTPDGTVSTIDAANIPTPDAFACPDECTRCQGNVCVIECEGTGACGDTVICPAGIACEVECNGIAACAGGIDCSLASECELTCDGIDSCAQQLLCGAGGCDITCLGISSCGAGLDCSDSCDCNATCSDGCGTNVCPGSAACEKDGLCTNTPGSCRTCTP